METKETKLEKEPKKNLMNFKKQELIDIILRKDDVERGLKKDIMGMECKQKELERKLTISEKLYKAVQDELNKANNKIDKDIKYLHDAEDKIKFCKKEQKRMHIITTVSLIIAMIGIAVAVIC